MRDRYNSGDLYLSLFSTVSEWGNLNEETIFSDYDQFGRPGTITAPDGQVTSLDYTGVSIVDRTASIAKPGGLSPVTVREIYDRHGRLFQVEEPLGAATAYRYAYDEGNRLTEVSTGPADESSAFTGRRTFEYDGRGFLSAESHPEKSTVVTYSSYDARGHAGRRSDGPNTLDFGYDDAERLEAILEASSGSRPLKTFTFGGAAGLGLGKLHQATRHNWVDPHWYPGGEVDVAVTETYDYNGLGGRIGARETAIQIAAGFTFRFDQGFVYDDLGNVSRIDYPSCTHTGCDAAEPARQVTYGFTNGWPTDVGIPGAGNGNDYLGPLTYHPNGTWATRPHENGSLDHQVADPDGMRRPRRLYTEKERDTTILFDTGNYEYDGAGNIRTMHAELGNPDSFRYDDRSRLVHGELGGWSEDYVYDDFGNLTEVTTEDPQSTVTVRSLPADPATNRLTGATYDGPGNVIEWSLPQGGTYDFDYDGLDKLAVVDPNFPWPGGGHEWTDVYTADDERVLTMHNPYPLEYIETDHFHLRGLDGRLLRHFTRDAIDPALGQDNFAWAADYVHADRLIAKHHQGGATHHYHQDHLGSTRLITTDSAAVVSNHDYLPYGEEVTPAGATQVLKFTGHERDRYGTIDLDYMHARYYSPHMGRLLSTDPVGGDPQRPQSWNGYAYALDNPIKYIDPYGLFPCPGLEHVECDAEITVTESASKLDPYTGVVGLGDLTRGGSLLRSVGPLGDLGTGRDFGLLDVARARAFYGERSDAASGAGSIFLYDTLLDLLPESQTELGLELALAAVPGPLDNVAVGLVRTGLRRGAGKNVLEAAGTLNDARQLFKSLARGGKQISQPGYPGVLVRRPDGTFVGIRSISKSGPPTVDLGAVKIKFVGGGG